MQLALWHYLGLVVAGGAVGACSGFFGVGGGVVAIPALVLLFGFSQHQAQGLSLAIIVPTALVGAATYAHYGKVHWGAAAAMAVGAVIAAHFSAGYVQRVPREILQLLFALFLVAVAVRALPATTPRTMLSLLGVALVALGIRLIWSRG